MILHLTSRAMQNQLFHTARSRHKQNRWPQHQLIWSLDQVNSPRASIIEEFRTSLLPRQQRHRFACKDSSSDNKMQSASDFMGSRVNEQPRQN